MFAKKTLLRWTPFLLQTAAMTGLLSVSMNNDNRLMAATLLLLTNLIILEIMMGDYDALSPAVGWIRFLLLPVVRLMFPTIPLRATEVGETLHRARLAGLLKREESVLGSRNYLIGNYRLWITLYRKEFGLSSWWKLRVDRLNQADPNNFEVLLSDHGAGVVSDSSVDWALRWSMFVLQLRILWLPNLVRAIEQQGIEKTHEHPAY